MACLGIGVIGLGVHARRGHIDHLDGLPARLVAVCDTDPSKLADFPAAEQFSNEQELLADPSVDAVMIMTPDRFHIGTALAALSAGKHVFVEKPIIDRKEDEQALRNALLIAGGKKLTLTTCHPRRFDRPFLWLERNLGQFRDEFGAPQEFRFDFSYALPRGNTAGLHRSLLLDHFGHEIDLMHYLFGRQSFHASKLFDDETRYHVTGIRDDGMAFSFSGSRMLRQPVYPESCSVRFARGEIHLDMQSGTARIIDRERGAFRQETCGQTDYEGRFRAVNSSFIHTSLGIEPNYLEVDDLLVNNLSAVALADGREYSWHPSFAAATVLTP